MDVQRIEYRLAQKMSLLKAENWRNKLMQL